jgi:hypothetical protein
MTLGEESGGGAANPHAMTKEHEASRRLVKSPPELWAECSDPGCLARHLGEFGEIKITRVEPETTVAWEGERARGTVLIEPSGWGTRVTLTALTPIAPEATGTDDEVSVPEAALDEGAGPKAAVDEPTAEEEHDATAQETLEEPDPAVVAEAGRFRMRWRRLTARVRRSFRGLEPELDPPVEESPALDPPVEESPALDPPVGESPALDPPVEESPALDPPEAVTATDRSKEPEAVHEPEDPAPPEPEFDPEAVLVAALDSLGQAHHRPFSRA